MPQRPPLLHGLRGAGALAAAALLLLAACHQKTGTEHAPEPGDKAVAEVNGQTCGPPTSSARRWPRA